MKNKQTPIDYIEDNLFYPIQLNQLKRVLNEAQQLFKEQIKDAWEDGFMSSAEGWNGEIPPECFNEVLDTEKYYNETYGSQAP
jgi:hypothetical protein